MMDKGYDNRRCRAYLRRRGITARIARIGIESSQRLGRHRWVVERTVGWLLAFKRLALRYDRTSKTINALARLAVVLIAARLLVIDRCNVFLVATMEVHWTPVRPHRRYHITSFLRRLKRW